MRRTVQQKLRRIACFGLVVGAAISANAGDLRISGGSLRVDGGVLRVEGTLVGTNWASVGVAGFNSIRVNNWDLNDAFLDLNLIEPTSDRLNVVIDSVESSSSSLGDAGDVPEYHYFSFGEDLILVRMNGTEVWADDKGLDATEGWESFLAADSNGDGRSNLLDFAFDGDPNAPGSSRYAIAENLTEDGDDQLFGMTLPVRKGAVFSGTGVRPTLSVDGIVYRINGDTDLSAPYDLAVEEVMPALTTGLPSLGNDYEYRTFRAAAPLSSQPRIFLHASVEISE